MRGSGRELLHGFPKVRVRARELGQRHARDRCLPGLPQCCDAGRYPAWMRHDSSPGGVDEVDAPDGGKSIRRLVNRLPRREHWHDGQGIMVVGKQGGQAGAGRRNHRLVAFRELVPNSVDVDVVCAGESVDLVPGLEFEAQCRAALKNP